MTHTKRTAGKCSCGLRFASAKQFADHLARHAHTCDSGACQQARALYADDRISYADYWRGACCALRALLVEPGA